MTQFSLWLEFEIYEGGYPGPDDDPSCDFCNAMITLDGVRYAVNIWTFGYVDFARRHDNVGNEVNRPRAWLLPPDLIVEKLDRALITQAIMEMLQEGGLPDAWVVPDTDETAADEPDADEDDDTSGPVIH